MATLAADRIAFTHIGHPSPVPVDVREAAAAGQRAFGENYVQESVAKAQGLPIAARIIAWATFALNKSTAANFTGCIHFFFVIDTKWEIVHWDWFLANHSGSKNDGIAVSNNHASASSETNSVYF